MLSMMPVGFLFSFITFLLYILSLSSVHWLSIWVGLEINMMGFIPLLIYRGLTMETESSIKYFIMQALGSSMLMFGSLMSFDLSLSWEAWQYQTNPLGLTLIILSLFLKLGAFPFHFWLPEVMMNLSWINCLIFTTWQKLAPVFLLTAMTQSWNYQTIVSALFIMAGFSSIIGGLGGINQTQIRTLLAYSSIGHVGWMTFCALTSESALKIYFIIYTLISICLFANLWTSDTKSFRHIGTLKNETAKLNQLTLIFILLSLGGMPPLLGFAAKWTAISFSCIISSPALIFPLLLGSLMSLFYYLTLLFSMTFSSSMALISPGNQLPLQSSTISPYSLNTLLTPTILIINFAGAFLVLAMISMSVDFL
uniref:NADH-ubiquinone oxidoreductase chain 2 n=1 Tax=Haliotis tuberculata tuberculata TaxID=454124 RepID=D2DML7_HALTU|nr:NADH dehydrogenase subunit 2 [Haliotis tuberculata tuberculata]ACL81484.1 NADH dehydrogenase subunit 2 [Haliotis tuberculata tuberculata]